MKKNIYVAQITPNEEEDKEIFGNMQGTIEIKEDIIDPIQEKWDASE